LTISDKTHSRIKPTNRLCSTGSLLLTMSPTECCNQTVHTTQRCFNSLVSHKDHLCQFYEDNGIRNKFWAPL